MSQKSCSIEQIDNGFLIRTSHDPNDYANADYDTTYLPSVGKVVFAGSPEAIGAIVAEFYSVN